MRIFILANQQQKKELEALDIVENDTFIFKSQLPENDEYKNYDAFFILSDSDYSNYELFGGKPVFINKVVSTLEDLNLPANFSRINGWTGFLKRETWEIASNAPEKSQQIFKELKPKIIFVKDEPGFVAVRVISMIINEAFYALGENVSTKEEIDLAMKLGTNYPKGPFEWAQQIGIEKVYSLLKKLSEKEERYIPAPALQKLILEKAT
ncbi:MAG TPA: 3-hydroxyacyl-CoA dehydrogenase family protein [Hanamia sp.]|nr:3-hydroxyacyl-CoA dehydrogenase family protein [Hanamia sp.]